MGVPSVPRLRADEATFEAFLAAYTEYQAVLVRGCLPHGSKARRAAPSRRGGKSVGISTLRRLFAEHPRVVRRAFSVESAAGPAAPLRDDPDAAARLLGSSRAPSGPWYASLVVQRSRAAVSGFLEALPFSVPPFLQGHGKRSPARHSNAAWVFFGTNPAGRALTGRSEHTDVISHSGTWHLQLQGSKVWTIRPTAELARSSKSLRGMGQVRIRCQPGDVLCINTRLWWHSTRIPGRCPLTMSVARDMYLDGSRALACDMTNVDGRFATRNIARGAVIFTEDDAPDLELPRSRQSNCTLSEDPEGRLLVVAKRRIPAGDWLSLSDSEDEEDGRGAAKRRRR